MKVTFRLTRDARSLAGILSTRSVSEDAKAAVASFAQAVGASVLVEDLREEASDVARVTLTALTPEALPQLAEAWQKALVSNGVQADAIA